MHINLTNPPSLLTWPKQFNLNQNFANYFIAAPQSFCYFAPMGQNYVWPWFFPTSLSTISILASFSPDGEQDFITALCIKASAYRPARSQRNQHQTVLPQQQCSSSAHPKHLSPPECIAIPPDPHITILRTGKAKCTQPIQKNT